MNIKSIINRLFNSNIYESSIINLGDVIQIPKRNDIDDQQLLLNIDNYKKEYLDILNTKGYLLPNMLSSKEIQDEMKINIDLIVKLYLEYTEITDDKTSLITKYLKLRLYLDKVTELGNVVLARLIALKEIFNEKIIMSKHKRQRISYEINNLLSILVTFNSQRSALESEYNLYQEKLVSSNIDLNLTDEELNEVNKKLEDVCELVKSVMPNINVNEYKGITGLVALERMLEIYASKNTNNISEIKADFDDFRIHTFHQQYEDVIELLRRFEIQYRIFNEYSRNLITDDDLLELYRLKFKTQTHKFYKNDYDIELVNEKTTKKEYMCYKTIIEELIENIVKNNIFDGKTIKCMKNVLKAGKDIFDVDKILTDNFLLNALLAFNNRNFLKPFFDNYKISCLISDNTTNWNDYLPLSTIFKIDNVYLSLEHPCDIVSIFTDKIEGIKYLKELYLLKNNKENDFIKKDQLLVGKWFYFPEGLKSIKVYYNIKFPNSFYERMIKGIDHSIVIFPKSLEKVEGDIFYNKDIVEIKLNEGLKELDMRIFENQIINSIIIPSSVSKINYDTKFYLSDVEMCFNDFRNSKILNDDENLKSLFKSFVIFALGGIVNFKLLEIELLDIENEKKVTYYINLLNIEKEVIDKLNEKVNCDSQTILNMVVEMFKEEVYKQTGFMLGEDNIDILEESKEKILTRTERRRV